MIDPSAAALPHRRIEAGVWLSALLIVAIGVANIAWVATYRYDWVLDIDEAGYLLQAMIDTHALRSGGPGRWLAAIFGTSFAPLNPALTSLLMLPFGASENVGLLTNSLLFVALLFIVFFLTRDLAGNLAALAAAVLVATLPAVLEFSRTYHFSPPATLFFTAAVLSYSRSRAFEHRAWSLLFGMCVGLMTLSRTMTIAFLPAFAIASLGHAIFTTGLDRLRRRNIALAIGAFVVTAGPWYIANFHNVFEYLFSFGYGAKAAEYGADDGIFTLANLNSRIAALLYAMRPIHFAIIAIPSALVFAIGLIGGFRRRHDGAGTFAFYASALAFGCLAIIATSRNRGIGFENPALPTLAIVSVVFLIGKLRHLALRLGVVLALIACSAVVGLTQAHPRYCEHLPSTVTLPLVGTQRLFDCRGYIHKYIVESGLVGADGWTNAADWATNIRNLAQWRDTNIAVAESLSRLNHNNAFVVYASRHRLLNVNTVRLKQFQKSPVLYPVIQIEPTILPATVDSYRDWLTSEERPTACFVLLLNTNSGEFNPTPDIAHMTTALEALGFAIADQIPTPTAGQHLNIWKRAGSKC